MTKFDLIVIGSGPGGQRAAIQGAKIGKSVLIIERDRVGGNCLHTGTIPSKTLKEAVTQESGLGPEFLQKVMARKSQVVSDEQKIIELQLSRNHVRYMQGLASFIDPYTVQVSSKQGATEKVQGDFIILATGTRPRRPLSFPEDSQLLVDSDTILKLKNRPSSLCVLGAGVIGCEYASIFAKMGVPVTVVDFRTELLRGVDREVVDCLQKQLEIQGVKFILGAKFKDPQINGQEATVEINGSPESFGCTLYCMGRTGNVEALEIEKIGLNANARGLVDVNENFQSKIPHIYAVGDLIGSPALAATAAEQGRLAACHAFGVANPGFPKIYPYGIYTIPEISSVGAEEDQLQKDKVPYIVGRAKYSELARGKILGDEFGILKLLFHKENRKLLGVHIMGSQATELVHIGQVAISFGAKIDDLNGLIFNYPTLAEAYKVACLNAYNQFYKN